MKSPVENTEITVRRRNRQPVIAPEAWPAIIRRVAESVATGLTVAEAARLVGDGGISDAVLMKALADPRNRAIVETAKARFIESALADIRAGVKGWQAIAWTLERCYRERFGRAAEVEINNTVVMGLTIEEQKALTVVVKQLERNPNGTEQ